MVPSNFAVGQADPSSLGVPRNTPPFGLQSSAPADFSASEAAISDNPPFMTMGLFDPNTSPAGPEGPMLMAPVDVPVPIVEDGPNVGNFMIPDSAAPGGAPDTAGMLGRCL